MKGHYTDLATGRTTIESSLHLELKEHITAEVTLSGNSSIDMIQRWVRGEWNERAELPAFLDPTLLAAPDSLQEPIFGSG